MEDTLREAAIARFGIIIKVLILVLMEDTLRDKVMNAMNNFSGLNPCFNGRYSQRLSDLKEKSDILRVLILVLMEDTLRASLLSAGQSFKVVLILVLMEDTLRVSEISSSFY